MRVALPVETIVRELKGKLWLALNLLAEGHEVVFGELSSMKQGLDVIQPDVFFRTSAVFSETKFDQNQFLKENGTIIVVLDTEGGAFKGRESYDSSRLHAQMLPTIDRFFAWGQFSASVARDHNDMEEKTVLTGNPRFDVLQPHLRGIYEEEANDIKEEYGKYILVNTTFGTVNPEDGSRRVPKNRPAGKLFHEFIEMCRWLSNSFEDLSVVVRPHPGENHETYVKNFQDDAGISVEHYGDVRSWMYGAEATVHNNSTTGIEGLLMDRPVFAYTPVSLPEERVHLSNKISRTVETRRELRREISSSIENSENAFQLTEEKKAELKRYIWNVDCSATKAIVEEINAIQGNWAGAEETNFPIADRLKRLAVQSFGVEPTEKLIGYTTGREYSKLRQKFPRLSKDELISEADRFQDYISHVELDVAQIESLGYVYELRNKRSC